MRVQISKKDLQISKKDLQISKKDLQIIKRVNGIFHPFIFVRLSRKR